jgi:hypothetical protein
MLTDAGDRACARHHAPGGAARPRVDDLRPQAS